MVIPDVKFPTDLDRLIQYTLEVLACLECIPDSIGIMEMHTLRTAKHRLESAYDELDGKLTPLLLVRLWWVLCKLAVTVKKPLSLEIHKHKGMRKLILHHEESETALEFAQIFLREAKQEDKGINEYFVLLQLAVEVLKPLTSGKGERDWDYLYLSWVELFEEISWEISKRVLSFCEHELSTSANGEVKDRYLNILVGTTMWLCLVMKHLKVEHNELQEFRDRLYHFIFISRTQASETSSYYESLQGVLNKIDDYLKNGGSGGLPTAVPV